MSVEGILAADIATRADALASITAGLTGPEADRWFARDRAEARIAALEDDADIFGLLPHEETELEQLRALVAK